MGLRLNDEPAPVLLPFSPCANCPLPCPCREGLTLDLGPCPAPTRIRVHVVEEQVEPTRWRRVLPLPCGQSVVLTMEPVA